LHQRAIGVGFRIVLGNFSHQGVHLRAVGGGNVSNVHITGLEHREAGTPFGNLLEDDFRKLGRFAPVIFVAYKNDLVLVDKFVNLEGTGAVSHHAEGIIGGRNTIVILPGLTGSIPTAIFNDPFLIHDRAPVVGDRGDERTPGLRECHGDCASGIIRHDRVLHFLAGFHQDSRISGSDASLIIVEVSFGIDKQRNVINTNAEEGLSQQELR